VAVRNAWTVGIAVLRIVTLKDRTVRFYPAADRGRAVAAPLLGKLRLVPVGVLASGVTERWVFHSSYTTSGFRTERPRINANVESHGAICRGTGLGSNFVLPGGRVTRVSLGKRGRHSTMSVCTTGAPSLGH